MFTKKHKKMRNGASARWKKSGPRVEKIRKGSGELFRAYGVGMIVTNWGHSFWWHFPCLSNSKTIKNKTTSWNSIHPSPIHPAQRAQTEHTHSTPPSLRMCSLRLRTRIIVFVCIRWDLFVNTRRLKVTKRPIKMTKRLLKLRRDPLQRQRRQTRMAKGQKCIMMEGRP